jgi:hypothetical protein
MKFTEDKLSQNLPPKQLTFLDEMVSCPSCLEILEGDRETCKACGVVIAQFKRVALEKRLKHTVAGLYHLSSTDCETLEKAWQKVESVYHDTELHNQFIHLCYRYKSMPFAAKKYGNQLEINPQDDIAELMKRRVLLLCQDSIPELATKTLPPSTITHSLMRIFSSILVFGMIGGVFLLLISALTQSKMYFFGLGLFIIISSLMSLLFMRRQLHF